MDHERRFKDKVPQHDATLADTPRVMGEALDALADLYDATKGLGQALIDEGLPRHAWRSEQAALHLLSTTLPEIHVGAFLTRLEEFATREGPAWLRGDHRDLAEFHEEVDILSDVAHPLQDVVHRLQRAPVGPWTDRPLQRAMRQPRLQTPLDTIVEILGDFEALAPFMRPLTPEQWRALLQSQAHGPLPAGVRPVETTASRPRTHRRDGVLPSSLVKAAALAATVHSVLGAVPTRLLQRIPLLRRWPRAGRWLAAAGLLLAVALAVLALSYRSHAPLQVSSASSHSKSLTALAGSRTATASTTGSPTPSPPPGATAPAGSTLKLALTCVPSGATATLTVKNLGSSSFTWQAQSPPTLTVSPAQGTLAAGQSAAVQVSAKSRKMAMGTITVIASHDTVSTQNKVSCR